MTKANVIQLGLLLCALSIIAYWSFAFVGFDDFKAGIASEILLVVILFGWVFSYFFRVITGKMTFMEQRKRYLAEYEKITNKEIEKKFDSMSKDEKIKLIENLGTNNNDN